MNKDFPRKHELSSSNYIIYNPLKKPEHELPVIFGFNNGGSKDNWNAVAIAENGKILSGHVCSNETFMLSDLGLVESSPGMMGVYKEHYPDGFRTEFCSYTEVTENHLLMKALERAKISVVRMATPATPKDENQS